MEVEKSGLIMLLCSSWATSATMSLLFFFLNFSYNLKIVFLNSKILIKSSPISTIKLSLYSFNSTTKPKPKHVFHGFNFVFHGFKFKHGNPLCFTVTILDGNPLCFTILIPIDNPLCSMVTISNGNPSTS